MFLFSLFFNRVMNQKLHRAQYYHLGMLFALNSSRLLKGGSLDEKKICSFMFGFDYDS